jgi:ABC-2 type transport system permease protein
MTRLLQSEWLKIMTTRTLVWYLLAIIVVVGISVAGHVANAPDSVLGDDEGFVDVLEAATWASIFALLFGLIGITGEYRHETITQSFLAAPVRERVIGAKLLTYAGAGLLLGALALGIAGAMALPWLAAEGVDAQLGERSVVLFVVGLLATTALWGALGVAFATVVPNQVAAVVSAFVWLLILETVLAGLAPDVARYSPRSAGGALMRVEGEGSLSMWGGAAVTLGYIAALAALGSRLVVRRDVT